MPLQHQNEELPVVGKYRKLFVRRFQVYSLDDKLCRFCWDVPPSFVNRFRQGHFKKQREVKAFLKYAQFHKAAGHPDDCIKSLQVIFF